MRTLTNGASFAALAVALATLPSCSGTTDEPTYVMGPVGSGGGGSSSTNTPSTGGGGSGNAGGAPATSGGSEPASTGGSGAIPGGGSGTIPGGGSGTLPSGGTGSGGAAGGSSGGSGGSGGGGTDQPIGHFKMLVYYETRAFRHDSIAKGIQMLQELGAQNDFDVTISDGEQNDSAPITMGDDDIITPEKLAPFDIVFFMNPTGDIFTPAEKMVFIDYLHQKKAFAGVHSTTDTEHSWSWYEDLVGEIYDGHSAGTPSGTITIEESQKNHPAMAGIQSPWTRNEEWYKFNNRINNGLPGVTILMRYGGPDSGGTIGQPLAWTRDWEGIRSFYTAIGHAQSTWDEPLIRKHVLGGILWAVGRLK